MVSLYLLLMLIACDHPLASPTHTFSSLKGALETTHSFDFFLDPLSGSSVL